jgi:hypothetical protein
MKSNGTSASKHRIGVATRWTNHDTKAAHFFLTFMCVAIRHCGYKESNDLPRTNKLSKIIIIDVPLSFNFEFCERQKLQRHSLKVRQANVFLNRVLDARSIDETWI